MKTTTLPFESNTIINLYLGLVALLNIKKNIIMWLTKTTIIDTNRNNAVSERHIVQPWHAIFNDFLDEQGSWS